MFAGLECKRKAVVAILSRISVEFVVRSGRRRTAPMEGFPSKLGGVPIRQTVFVQAEAALCRFFFNTYSRRPHAEAAAVRVPELRVRRGTRMRP